MAKKKELPTYKGLIDEFVDWISGENVVTGEQVTDGQQVSGGSIRLLIQSRLREPIVVTPDEQLNVYRFFPSRAAEALYNENPSDNADFQLFTIPRPSDYTLELFMINPGDRYIKYGDDVSNDTKIQFTWKIHNDREPDVSDGISVTYTITNTDGSSQSFTRGRRYKQAEDFSLVEYLKPGENSITIEAKGNRTGATSGTGFTITVLDLQISSDFNFAGKHSKNESLRTPYSFRRNNNNGTAKIYFYVDGTEIKNATVDVFEGGQLTIEDSGKMINPTLSEGLHSLQIFAAASYNGITIYSNVLYYTFVIQSTVAGATTNFINIATSFTMGLPPFNSLTLTGVQYYPQELRWGYYTDATSASKMSVTWKLLEGADDQDPQTLPTIDASSGYEADSLNFTPTIYTDDKELFLSAYHTVNNQEIQLVLIPIYIIQNTILTNIYETDNYELKMSAYGRTNGSSNRAIWNDVTDTVTTTFTNIDWNPNSGWYNNSFRTSGTNQYAMINFEPFIRRDLNDTNFPFTYGKTIEIDFESEKVNSNSDKLVVIGNPNGAHIEITPNTATLFDNGQGGVPNEVVHTNYKANERIKLAFIINKVSENSASRTVDDGLAYIINNGVLERGAIANGRSFATSGKIKIGGSNSGVRVYSIRVYDKSISYDDAYSNYIYDSDNKVSIVNKNDILVQGQIAFELCKDKIDTIVITGDLSNILDQTADKDDSETDVMIERYCYYDSTKDFLIGDVIDDPDRPGKKKVVDGCRIRKHGQSTLNYPISSMKFWTNKSVSGNVPIFYKTGQELLMLNKNRYKMKDSSIPSNKFVLQANYADSSGVHNGGLLRLIQDSWYNARIAGVSDPYKLRTLPQLFTTIKSNEKQNYGLDSVWQDYFPQNEFPYRIRISADSVPCAVFYVDLEGSGQHVFLGLYVLMDDKKSDYTYGERSIYKVKNDPFCLTVNHKDEDTKTNRIWDNENVLRIEVLEINKTYSSYTTTEGFDTFSGGKYGWESQFELIYPDEDDIIKDDEVDKSSTESKFYKKTKPFVDWYKWVVSTRNNQQKFQDEAADHLDLYKLAAYYIFVLRFALVDSLERNAQIKTYDGVHFHYEPWDMDIALGNKNDGGIAFNPPVDRNTKLNTTTYAISGKMADGNGDVIRSNWLWDALEAWPLWMNEIVPKVADALFNTGVLTYDNVTEMFDDNYANKWCEIMYNRSGHFKYVESAGGDLQRWLGWLQGSRMSHRHWWLSTSMDYYDAKWFCGDYKSHRIYLAANVSADANKFIRIMPNGSTYMTLTVNNLDENTNTETEEVDTTREVSRLLPFEYSMEAGASTKAPIHIYGANFMEEIDMSDIAIGIDALDLTGTYSSVLGAPLKVLNVGTKLSGSGHTFTTTLSPATGGISPSSEGVNAFENLETLNIRGFKHLGNVLNFSFTINQWMRDLNMSRLINFYAMGSNLTNFYSSNDGNNFNEVELPSSVSIINMKNSTWNSITFWDTTEGLNDQATLTYHETTVGNETVNIPPTITEVHFLGSTGRTRESLLFIRDWLKSIVATYGESALSSYTLEMDDVFWSQDVIGNDSDLLTYDELRLISKMNGEEPDPNSGVTKTHPIRGYVMLKYEGQGTELTAQQLTNIRNWFGDGVFTKGSSGLVVDYKHDYIQINIGGDVSIVNGEVYLQEGKNAILEATEFHLAEPGSSVTSYVWGIGEPGSQTQDLFQINGVTLIDGANTSDGKWYLSSQESQVGQDYDVQVNVTVGGMPYNATLHVIAAKYPSSVYIGNSPVGVSIPRVTGNNIALWTSGNIGADLFLTTDDMLYTATVSDIVYTITGSNNQQATYSVNTGKSWNDVSYITYENGVQYLSVEENTTQLGLNNTSCLRIRCNSVPQNNDIFEYQLTATVTFRSGKAMTATVNILVLNDGTPIVSALNNFLYPPIATRWQAQFGEQLSKPSLYRTDLRVLTGTLTFTSSGSAERDSLVTAKNTDSLLDYIPNVEGLVFDNITNLTSTKNTIVNNNGNQFVFDKMPNLRTLSIQNCTGLTEDIDLTLCPEITQVDASGTSINVLIPKNAKLTKYELGTPTSINIDEPTVLTVGGIKVDSYSSLDSLNLINIPNNLSFNAFDKVMLAWIIGGMNIEPYDADLYVLTFYIPNEVTSAQIRFYSGITVNSNVSLYTADGTYIDFYRIRYSDANDPLGACDYAMFDTNLTINNVLMKVAKASIRIFKPSSSSASTMVRCVDTFTQDLISMWKNS